MLLNFHKFQKGQAEGSKRELQQTIANIQSDLNMNHYKNADKNYRDKNIELMVGCCWHK